jgi:hypothetical protein
MPRPDPQEVNCAGSRLPLIYERLARPLELDTTGW